MAVEVNPVVTDAFGTPSRKLRVLIQFRIETKIVELQKKAISNDFPKSSEVVSNLVDTMPEEKTTSMYNTNIIIMKSQSLDILGTQQTSKESWLVNSLIVMNKTMNSGERKLTQRKSCTMIKYLDGYMKCFNKKRKYF